MKKLIQVATAILMSLGRKLEEMCFDFLVSQGLILQAYFGTTAASSVSNPPVLLSRIAGARTILGTSGLSAWSSGVTRAGGLGLWQYISTNVTTDLTTAGFFTDGAALGMQVGDILLAAQYTSAGSSFIMSAGVLTTTASSGGFNLTTLGTITSTRASSL